MLCNRCAGLRSFALLFVSLTVLGGSRAPAADEDKPYYTSEWLPLEDAGARGRKMVIVIHNTNTPKGTFELVVKFALGGEFPIGQTVTDKNGNTADVSFIRPPAGTNILKHRVRIRSIRWNGVAVPEKPPQVKKDEKKADPPKPDDKENRAAVLFRYAKKLVDSGMVEKARGRLEEIVKEFPDTGAAGEAKGLLEKLPKK